MIAYDEFMQHISRNRISVTLNKHEVREAMEQLEAAIDREKREDEFPVDLIDSATRKKQAALVAPLTAARKPGSKSVESIQAEELDLIAQFVARDVREKKAVNDGGR